MSEITDVELMLEYKDRKDMLQEITKLKKALELANTQIAILLENSECRGDEDCDHCMAIGAQKQIKEIMEG